MKVLALNASPRKEGNTFLLLQHVLKPLKAAGHDTKLIQIGGKPLHGCRGCLACFKMKNGCCVFQDDIFNETASEARQADALIFGTPSYFSGMTAELKAFIDRLGLVSRANGFFLRHKIGAAVIAQRRAGADAIQADIHRMFLMSEMIIPGSTYWNMGFGQAPGEVNTDEEGLKNMENLGENIAWLLDKIYGTIR